VYVPLQVNRFPESILLVVQYGYLKSFSGDFYSQESSAQDIPYWFLITQSGWVFHFHVTESVSLK